MPITIFHCLIQQRFGLRFALLFFTVSVDDQKKKKQTSTLYHTTSWILWPHLPRQTLGADYRRFKSAVHVYSRHKTGYISRQLQRMEAHQRTSLGTVSAEKGAAACVACGLAVIQFSDWLRSFAPAASSCAGILCAEGGSFWPPGRLRCCSAPAGWSPNPASRRHAFTQTRNIKLWSQI